METVSFSLKNASKGKFDDFIYKLRTKVRDPQGTSHGIPVLYKSVANSKRFVLVELDNYGDDKITVPIDVLSLYVVGHLGVDKDGRNCFYYLKQDDKTVPIATLFPGTQRKEIPFTGNYPDLKKYAGDRENILLGASPLNIAIQTLKGYRGDALYGPIAKSFTVIIQMVAEVARYGFIQRQIGDKIGDGEFSQKPGFKTMSLQNEWSSLSLQIQRAPTTGGQKFKKDVVLKDEANKNVTISDVNAAIKFCDISMLHYESAAAAFLLLLEQQLQDQVN